MRIAQAKAFSLIEATTALIILSFISASVLVVINRCVVSAADSAMRMQAFEVARDNMEKLLIADSVKLTADFGTSDKNPEIQWQTVVESFYEPITQRVWVKGTCSAEYTDSAGETQTIELTHWLTDLTKQQLLELIKQLKEENALLADQMIETVEKAAEYAKVDVQTIQQWIDKGMPMLPDGSFAKIYLDIFIKYNGTPPPEKIKDLPSPKELIKPPSGQTKPSEPDRTDKPDGTKPEPDGTKPTVEPKPEPNPFGLPDDYEDWPLDKLMGWLQDHGYF